MIKFSINVTGIDDIRKKLQSTPNGFRVLLTVIAQYILGDESRGLRSYAPWKKVTRAQAYGQTFKNDKQRKAFFAKLKSGEINVPYNRTGRQGKAWRMERVDNHKAFIANRERSVGFTRGQTKLHKLMGWMNAKAQALADLPAATRRGKDAFLIWLKTLR